MKTPDFWAAIKITTNQGDESMHIHSRYCSGFLEADSWELSTPVVSCVDKGDHLFATTKSGSTFRLRKTKYYRGITNNCDYMLSSQCRSFEVSTYASFVSSTG